MLSNRINELKYLNTYYERAGSQIIVMYGTRGIGKHTIITDFLANKPNYYYKARPASEREQLYRWGCELTRADTRDNSISNLPKYPNYDDIFNIIVDSGKFKNVLIIDDFQYIVKNSPSFMQKLVDLAHGQWNTGQVMIILLSSQIGWIENSMVEKIGEHAYELSGFLKIKELSFYELTIKYRGFKLSKGIETYAILGGNPGMWQYFNDQLSTEENICQNILPKHAYLRHHAERIVADELRETGIYNTILAAIAEGHQKLSDLYLHTSFSRAKISVYLKNLMELQLVEKIFSYDAGGKDNSAKGYYRITNHFVHFYFTYLYPNLSDLTRLSPPEFFRTHIAPSFKSYVTNYFKMVCINRLEQWNRNDELPLKFAQSGEWVGKVGTIDIIAKDDEGRTLIGLCNWEKPFMSYEDYEWLLFCAQKAQLQIDYIYLFSADRFDEKLNLEAKVKQNIRLIGANEL